MPVKSFLPVTNARIVIEKPVKHKPTLSELTKIEQTGRIIRLTAIAYKRRLKLLA